MSYYPRQDLPETEKNLEWCKKMMDFAVSTFEGMSANRLRISRQRQSYNGIVNKKRVEYLTKTYGKRIRTKFIDYRLGRPKIDLVNGEWLKRSLNSTVRSENKEAVHSKMNKYYKMLAIAGAAEEIEKVRQLVGYNGLDGMEMPTKDEQGRPKINVKLKNEIFMEHALRDQIRKRNMKASLSENFKDLEITSECHGIVEIKANRMVDYIPIMPEDKIYIESSGDPFLHKSPIRGHRRWAFIHDVLNEYSGDPEFQGEKGDILRKKLEQIKSTTNTTTDSSMGGDRKYYRSINNELAVEIFRIEWISSRPVYTKVFPNGRKVDVAPEFYEKSGNKKKIRGDEEKGQFELVKEWKMEPWEATRIGQDIYLRCRRKENQLRSVDAPHDPWRSYISLLFNTQDGIRISLQELMDNISFLYNVVMFQINRELSKSKGKVIPFDLAGLAKGMTARDVAHDMADDGIYFYNSAAEGNKLGVNVLVNGMLKELDLGISSTMGILISLKLDLQNMADNLTGVPQDRMGQIESTSTVTNAQSNIVASRTITEPMFYYMERFTEEVFRKYLEAIKVAWGIMGSDEGDLIIGEEGKGFFKATREISNDDYGVYLIDGQRELQIREKLDGAAGIALNSKELRLPDWLKVQLSETLSEAESFLEKGWEKVEAARIESAKIRAQSAAEELKAAREMAIEDREDTQAHEVNLEMIKQGGKGIMESEKNMGKSILQEQKGEQTREAPKRR